MTHWKRIGATVVATVAILGMSLGAPSKAEARGDRDHDGPHGFVTGHFGFRPYFGLGFGFGPYGGPYWANDWWGPWGGRYWGPDPYFYPEGGASLGYAMMAGFGAIDMNVKPNQADVWVDGKYVAEARDLDGSPSYLWLKAGDHDIQVYKGGYVTFNEKVNVRAGVKTELKVRLTEGVAEPPSGKTS